MKPLESGEGRRKNRRDPSVFAQAQSNENIEFRSNSLLIAFFSAQQRRLLELPFRQGDQSDAPRRRQGLRQAPDMNIPARPTFDHTRIDTRLQLVETLCKQQLAIQSCLFAFGTAGRRQVAKQQNPLRFHPTPLPTLANVTPTDKTPASKCHPDSPSREHEQGFRHSPRLR